MNLNGWASRFTSPLESPWNAMTQSGINCRSCLSSAQRRMTVIALPTCKIVESNRHCEALSSAPVGMVPDICNSTTDFGVAD
jgi:hypothetical protein